MVPLRTNSIVALVLLVIGIANATRATPVFRSSEEQIYFPPAGTWAKRTPQEAGIDPARLEEAIAYALANPSKRELDFSDQERIFGKLLGSMPTRRAHTNGLVIHRGYVVAEFGDTSAVDPTYSVAKSMLATVAGVGVRDGRIGDVDEPVGARVSDGGYASEHNAKVTWRMHLQQQSEWEGEMWGKHHAFLGVEEYGEGAREPRSLAAPGSHYEYNDVRVNRFALSLLRVFEEPVPDVFDKEVMSVIGASSTWKWVPYHNSYATVDGRRMASVSGGTRWGGGVWINSWDLARFGYLWLREGRWGESRVIPLDFVKAAKTPSEFGPDYGFLWWLNTKQKNYPGLPTNVFGARGAGSNTITISPDHDLLVVWRWHSGSEAELLSRVISAIR